MVHRVCGELPRAHLSQIDDVVMRMWAVLDDDRATLIGANTSQEAWQRLPTPLLRVAPPTAARRVHT